MSHTAAEIDRKVAFYRIRAARAPSKVDKEYWLRIAEYWREQAAVADNCDDQIN
ncbi:MAG: hypothetical protein IT537_18755 [Hyphomicrobiales bacterium]|nr:hypothetical protein [Hyphomicrobiales bacterium]